MSFSDALQGENGQFQTISLPYLQEGITITISPSIDRSVRLGVASSSADIIPLACAASSDKVRVCMHLVTLRIMCARQASSVRVSHASKAAKR